MIIVIVIIVIIIALAIWFVACKNSFVQAKNLVDEAFSTIDVYLNKRYDLIPKLVDTVKAYAKHESDTFEKVVSMRSKAQAASLADLEGKIRSEQSLQSALNNLFVIAEDYPDLKASTNFADLQRQIKAVENDIANARKYYNGTVRQYNNKVETFPSGIVASIFHYSRLPFFELTSETKRESVPVEF